MIQWDRVIYIQNNITLKTSPLVNFRDQDIINKLYPYVNYFYCISNLMHG